MLTGQYSRTTTTVGPSERSPRLSPSPGLTHARGARAAVNDGFGGGNNATRNLLFNTCRETGDHGPINSWDRCAAVPQLSPARAR